MKFQLDTRLQQDCYLLGESDDSLLLLNKSADVPWFILAPKTNHTELFELAPEQQQTILQEINWLSSWLKTELKVDKLNVAAIGNIVSQLHIHVVGRSKGDFCWPGVVWGAQSQLAYSDEKLAELKAKLSSGLFAPFNWLE